MNESQYLEAFRGRFSGILRWHQLDALWHRVRRDSDGGWYIYAVGEEPPTSTATSEQLRHFVAEVDALLRREHDEDYCGIVYADSREEPSFIKVYDPNHLGMVCGSSSRPTLPGWTLSKLAPVDLPAAMPPPQARRRWWQRIVGG